MVKWAYEQTTIIIGTTDELEQAKTRKKEFLEQMNAIIPWNEWIGIIQPYYYKGKAGNKPFPLETMLRIHMLQNLYNLLPWTRCATHPVSGEIP
jgi:hypothetical protein